MAKLLAALAAIAASALLGFWSGTALGGPRSLEPPLPKPDASVTAYGMTGLLRLDVDPVAVVHSSSGDRLRYEITFSSQRPATASIAVSYYVTDAAGNIVVHPVYGPVKAAVGRLMGSEEFETPSELEDGFYILHAFAAAYGEMGEGRELDSATSLEKTTYFRVHGGKAEPMSPEEWVRAPETKHVRLAVDGFVEPLSAYEDYEDFLERRQADIERRIQERERQ